MQNCDEPKRAGGESKESGESTNEPPDLVVVQLKAHAIVNLIVLKRDVILEDCVPLLYSDLLGPRARLRCQQFLQVADRVVLVAFDSDLLSQSVVADHFNHDSAS